jgi:ferredoxin
MTAADADLVIEAVIEGRKIGGQLFQDLNKAYRPDLVFATNTSTLSVAEFAVLSGRAERFLGCFGCGNCTFTCPNSAMTLQRRQKEIVPPRDSDHLYDVILANKKGPFDKAAPMAKLMLKI